jgi:hypothetical protein
VSGESDSLHPEVETLYRELAEPAPPADEVGQTRVTATKETIDDDRESVWLEALDGS